MNSPSQQELLTAISSGNLEKCEALIQSAAELNSDILLSAMVLSTNIDIFRALLKHSSINPFFNDNNVLRMLLTHNLITDFLPPILEHPMNHLTADHYREFISLCDRSHEKRELLQSYLNKL